MRANGVRSLAVSCWLCHHRAILSADPWPDHVPVPAFGPSVVCTRCGMAMSAERHGTITVVIGATAAGKGTKPG